MVYCKRLYTEKDMQTQMAILNLDIKRDLKSKMISLFL